MMTDGESSDEDWGERWDDNRPLQRPRVAERASTALKTVENASLGKDHSKKFKNEESATSKIVSRMQLNDHKAGMEGLDKEKINKIIYKASKGSKYYENELKKEMQVNKRITEQKEQKDRLSKQTILQAECMADDFLEELESTRDLTHSIVHVDMDAFYAAVEMRDDPSLVDKPMAVGGNSMLSTSNYVARKYGVRAGMPGFIAKKLCPNLIIVGTNFEKYTDVSKMVREILADYDPNFCPMSLDEAYLDFTEHLQMRKDFSIKDRTFGEVRNMEDCVCRGSVTIVEDQAVCEGPEEETKCSKCGLIVNDKKTVSFGSDIEEAVREMRHRIHVRTRLTASAGIAPNTMLAKVCSDKNKPNGQYRVLPNRPTVMSFVNELPIRKVSGIGKVSEKMLSSIGVVTCMDLHTFRGLIKLLYSDISFNYFMRITLGLGSTFVVREGGRKSLSTECTFSELSKPEDMYEKCSQLCTEIVKDLKNEKLFSKTVAIKIKTVKFETKTRAHTIQEHTQNYEQIYKTACDLLKVEIQACLPQPLKLRLMGVRMSSLLNENDAKNQRQNTITSFLQKKERTDSTSNIFINDTNPENVDRIEEVSENLQNDLEKVVTSPKNAVQTHFKSKYQDNSNDPNVNSTQECTALNDLNLPEVVDKHCSNTNISLDLIKDSSDIDSSLHKGYPLVPLSLPSTSECDQSFACTKNKAKITEVVTCPVCNRTIKSTKMKVITDHIDYCLSKTEDQDLGHLNEESKETNNCDEKFIENIKPNSDIDNNIRRSNCMKEASNLNNNSESACANSKFAHLSDASMSSSCTKQIKITPIDNKVKQLLDSDSIRHSSSFAIKDNLVVNTENISSVDPYTTTTLTHNHLFSTKENTKISSNHPAHKDIQFEKIEIKGKILNVENDQFVMDNKKDENTLFSECKTEKTFAELGENTTTGNINKDIHQYRTNNLDSISASGTEQHDIGEPCSLLENEYICPVCNICIVRPNLAAFNEHVDTCLNRQTIKEMLNDCDVLNNSSANSPAGTSKRTNSASNKGKMSNKKRKIEKGLQTLECFMKK